MCELYLYIYAYIVVACVVSYMMYMYLAPRFARRVGPGFELCFQTVALQLLLVAISGPALIRMDIRSWKTSHLATPWAASESYGC